VKDILNTKYVKLFTNNIHYIIWFIAIGCLFGSLYFSEVVGLIPCTLCWWLRIFLYPLAFISSVAIVRKETNILPYYVLPLAIPATILSFYHSLLQWGVIKETITICSAQSAVPCDKPDFLFLGFVTLPFLGFISSIALVGLSFLQIYLQKKHL
jgi:disulfide bond formation protein DsbB